VHSERKTYAQILGDMASAEYLTDVSDPAPWLELAFLGRWNLTYDGHKGILDLYHIPGIGIWPRPSDPDRRLGVFYDSAGTAFRVNGTLSGSRIEFWIDGRKPNLAWHELTGRRFVYYLDPAVNVMAGLHYDGDGRSYGGYATKTNEVAHGKPAGSGLAALANTTWTMLLGERQGPVRFGDDLGGRVVGTMTDASGVSRGIEANLLDAGQVTFWSEGGLSVATAKFLSHEPGLICGNTNDGRPFYAAYVASR
jgi:hypothetical protein